MSERAVDIICLQSLDVWGAQDLVLAGEDIFYFDNRGLFQYSHATRGKKGNSRPIPVPEGQLVFSVAIGGRLAVITRRGNSAILYQREDENWRELLTLPAINPVHYQELADGRILAHGNKNIWLIDPAHGKWHELVLDNAPELIAFAILDGDTIWLANTKPVQVIKCEAKTALARAAETPGGIVRMPAELVLSYNAQTLIPLSPMLASRNGYTELVGMTGKQVFQDTEPGKCGYQIFAQGKLALNKDWIALGSVRRDETHPCACVYIMDGAREVWKKTDGALDRVLRRWTGYTSSRAWNVDKALVFNNTCGKPCLIRGFCSVADFTASGLAEGAKLEHMTDEVMIFSHTYEETSTNQLKLSQVGVKTQDYATPDMPSNLYITIDVEQHRGGLPFWVTGGDLEPVCGISFIMDTLEKYGLRGTFFVDVYEDFFLEDTMAHAVRDIHARGHEVGLHYHAHNLTPWQYSIPFTSAEDCVGILKHGMDFISKITGSAPVSFRSGAYKIADHVFPILEQTGIRVDSSIYLQQKQQVHLKSKNAVCRYGSVIEIPVSTHTLGGYPSKIDINSCGSARTMLKYARSMRNYGIGHIMTMLHSFSFLDLTTNRDEACRDMVFSGGRMIKGVNTRLMAEFDKFCQDIARMDGIRVKTIAQALADGDFEEKSLWGSDIVPSLVREQKQTRYCPICGSTAPFESYRGRPEALCVRCNSLERTRFKMAWLKQKFNIEYCMSKKILHFGPNLVISQYIRNLGKHDYISSDPYNDAEFKFPTEDIPFAENTFDLIIAVGVFMHVLDDRKGFREIFRTLKRGGKALLWLGGISEDETKEFYDRAKYSRMVAADITIPDDLYHPLTTEKDGKIYYNPRYKARIYGKDIYQFLATLGFKLTFVKGAEIEGYARYGIRSGDTLIECLKK